MAQRTKTIEYAFPLSTGSVASAASRAFTQLAALAIPESTSRTFRSVILEVSYMDNDAAAASMTAILVGIQLGAAGFSDVTVTQTIANSGEQTNCVVSRDVTAYFVSNYSGTTMTCDARMTVTGKVTVNATAKLIITYEYDDSGQTTQIKTVRIPVDGNIGALTNSFVNVGTTANQFPLLDQFLPEMSKTYRDIFFEMNINQGTVAAQATNPVLNMRYDGSTTVADTAHEDALASDTFYRRIDKLLGIATNAAHSIEANVTQTAGSQQHACLNGVLVVTYEYNATVANLTLAEDLDSSETVITVTDASAHTAPFAFQIDDEYFVCTSKSGNDLTVLTRPAYGSAAAAHSNGATCYMAFINSLVLPCIGEPGAVAGTATGDKSRQECKFVIQEPGLPLLAQSGILCSYIDAGTVSIDFRAGSQASRVYVSSTGAKCGGSTFLRRIDAGSVGGVAAVTLTRGFNTVTFDWFTTSATSGDQGRALNGVLYLNYYSRRHADGVGVHNHSTAWCIKPYAAFQLSPRIQTVGATTPNIPEASYYVTQLGYQFYTLLSGTSVASMGMCISAEVQSGEGEGAGWRVVRVVQTMMDAEIGPLIFFCKHDKDNFFEYAADLDTSKMNPETARDYRYDTSVTTTTAFFGHMWLTYHAITYTMAGDITDSDGGTVNIDVHRVDTGQMIAQTSRSGDGAWSRTLYDNTVNVAARAYEDADSFGASREGLVDSGDFDISMHTGGPGGAGGQGISQGLHTIDSEIAA